MINTKPTDYQFKFNNLQQTGQPREVFVQKQFEFEFIADPDEF